MSKCKSKCSKEEWFEEVKKYKELADTIGYLCSNDLHSKYSLHGDEWYITNAPNEYNLKTYNDFIKFCGYELKYKRPYTKEEVISLMQKFFREHNKIIIRDFKNRNGLCSIDQVIKYFGTFQNALKEANIPIENENLHNFNREQLSDKEVLKMLKKETKKHLKNHMFLITSDEIDLNKNLPSASIFNSKFGGIRNAYKLIGYDVEKYNKNILEKDMIKKYKELCENLGRTANSRDIDKYSTKNLMYSCSAYTNHFGTVFNLQKMCGYHPTILGKDITKEQSLKALKQLYSELGRVPIQKDIECCDYLPSPNYFGNKFGSYTEALKQAGLDHPKIYKTKNGTVCYSSYEYVIATILEKKNIVFDKEIRYDKVINNFNKNYRFDYQITLNKNTYYIEIFGITGNEAYDIKTNEKIEICNLNNIPLICLYPKDIWGKKRDEIWNIILDKINDIGK